MLAERLPGSLPPLLDLPGQLFVELEAYAGEVARVQNERAARDAARQRQP